MTLGVVQKLRLAFNMQFDISRPMSGESMAPPIAVLHTTLISSDTELRDIEPSAAAADDLRITIEENSAPISPETDPQ